jgi:hypothetical protein
VDRLYGGCGDDYLVSEDPNSKGIGTRDVVDGRTATTSGES